MDYRWLSTKHFPTLDALSAITGSLVSERGIGAVYEVLNWMSGEDLFTHQLPRVSQEAQAAALAFNPALAAACVEAEQVTRGNYSEWQAKWLSRYGETIQLPLLAVDQHERIDPLSELAEKVHPDNIVVVKP